MSDFLKRLGDVAKKAKDTLEESGVIDEAKALVTDAVDSVSSSASASKDSSGGASTAQVPAGVVDPATLITPRDVSEVTGRRFDHQYAYRDDEWFGTTITSSDQAEQGYFELRAGHADDYGGYDPHDRWQFLRTEVSPQEELDGVGDEAFRSEPDIVYFRKDDQVMHTVANFGGDASTASWVEALARRAADRI